MESFREIVKDENRIFEIRVIWKGLVNIVIVFFWL